MKKRLEFIDLARGFAVLLMVMWHTADSWVRPEERVGATWTWFVFFGGMAAPLFTSLAGVASGLRAERAADRPFDASVMRAQIGRGLEIIVLGYALRMQMWMVDGGGLLDPWGATVWVPGLSAIFLAIAAAKRLAANPRQSSYLFAAAIVLYAAAMIQLGTRMPERPFGLMRVDILQCIGASLVLVALAERGLSRRTLVALSAAVVVAVVAPSLEKVLPGVLPRPLAAYFARWPAVPGERPLAGFPLFPWLAYPLLGRAVGIAIARGEKNERLGKLAIAAVLLGFVLSVAGNETFLTKLGFVSAQTQFVYLVRVVARAGNLLVVLGVMYAASHAQAVRTSFVWVLGQASLFMYFVHMEFAYGISTASLKGKLALAEWAIACAALLAALTGVVYWKRTKRVDAWLDAGERLLTGLGVDRK